MNNPWRKDFPILDQKVHDLPLVYLDNANTTQKPTCVIQRMNDFYTHENANIHRGVHLLSEQATKSYEQVRTIIQKFINASAPEEIIFTRGGTEGINLIAQTFGKQRLQKGTSILISEMEHHSNIVPWKMICDEQGAELKVIPMNEQGDLNMYAYEELLTSDVVLVACTHLSNALGTLNPVEKVIALAHERNIPVVIDGCQALYHLPVDVQKFDADFYVGTGHKLYGPTGTGFVYGKKVYLDQMPPYQGGGDMILSVSFDQIAYNSVPHRFEAGTPNIVGIIGLGEAITYLQQIGMEHIFTHEQALTHYLIHELSKIVGVEVIGEPAHRVSVVSFVTKDIHPHDVGSFLDQKGIAVRTGHHCAQPVMKKFGVPATVRISLAMYNTKEEVDYICTSLKETIQFFS